MKILIEVSVKYGSTYPWPLEKHLNFVHISTSSQKAGRDTLPITQFQVVQFQAHVFFFFLKKKDMKRMKRVPNFPLPKWKLKNTKVAEEHWRAISQAGGQSC